MCKEIYIFEVSKNALFLSPGVKNIYTIFFFISLYFNTIMNYIYLKVIKKIKKRVNIFK